MRQTDRQTDVGMEGEEGVDVGGRIGVKTHIALWWVGSIALGWAWFVGQVMERGLGMMTVVVAWHVDETI